jgi:uncharacterized protein (TIGR03437 family)
MKPQTAVRFPACSNRYEGFHPYMSGFSPAREAERGLRLTFVFLTCFSLSAAVAAPPWIAHYVPVGAPGSQTSSGAAQALAVDSSGDIFVVAGTESSDQPQTCVFKLDPQGNQQAQVCFATGGSVTAAAADLQGNLVIAGTTSAPASLQLVSPLISNTGPEAGFIVKLNSQLTQTIFSTLLGGTTAGSIGQGTTVQALALDPSGNIYVSGWTIDGNFPLSTGAYQTIPPADAFPAFVTAISSAGDKILWSTLLGGPKACTSGSACADPGNLGIFAMAVDSTGAAVIAGYVNNEQVPVTEGVLGATCVCTANSYSAFLAKVAAAGTQLAWATYVNYASVAALALDAVDNVIIGGQAYAGFTATSGALQTTLPVATGTSGAGFAAKIDPSARHYLFATFLGAYFQPILSSYGIGNGANGVTGLALDANGTIWATGGAAPSTLPLSSSVPILGTNYILGLSPGGSSLTSATTAPEGGAGLAIAIAPQGPVALGKSGSTLIPTPGAPASLAGTANSAGPTASGAVAPNELVSFYGVGLGPSTGLSGEVVDGVLTTSLGGVQVQFDGVAAPLLYAGPNQINAIVPSGVAGQSSTTVTIVTPAGQIAGIALSAAPSVPEVFTYGPPGSAAIAMNQDWTLNSATNPAAPGSIVTVWASGGGLTGNPEVDGAITGTKYYPLVLPLEVGNGFPNSLSIGPAPFIPAPQVQYSGDAPDLVKGAIQVNFSIPQYPPPANAGAAEFYLQIGTAFSDPFTVYVQ